MYSLLGKKCSILVFKQERFGGGKNNAILHAAFITLMRAFL
jgi:hypothetical protein